MVKNKSFKHFIVYEDGKKVKLLCVILPRMSAYRRDFDDSQNISFLIEMGDMLDQSSGIWDKISKIIEKKI